MTDLRRQWTQGLARLAALGATALLVACSPGLQGTYEDALGLTRYTFQTDGKVLIQAMGTEVEMTYEKEGDKVKLGASENRVVLTVLEDGTLQGPMGVKLTLQRP